MMGQLAQAKVLGHTIFPKEEWSREVGSFSLRGLDECTFHYSLLSLKGRNERESKSGSCKCHRQCCRARSGLGLDHLGASLLDALGEGLQLGLREAHRGRGLGQQGHDGDARVAAHHGHAHAGRVQALRLSNKGIGANNVQGCYTENG